ncbi:MAG: copper resistance protein CopZ [Rhizobiales bacterium 17-65-6]|jgi:copper chaperone NosL|nr:MAG: copper resistance protein CopZ [Rhizobiales bacterium 32-66-11]OYY88659.1 MAG: copper resistance protein CopZ [Rhizobiales bacterium 35-66-30]OYZ82153.1 MAG: copper resistance protein CopZ [Rhizobiales bacterium 24-66-13]OYZ91263.1 MAG: copper resistance protein CopZ [Rhizobiales bacterium 17-65-6]OZB07869.1 MAG: copper resistance protein CopZ [Rhizobiales bacterium 39-66-18]
MKLAVLASALAAALLLAACNRDEPASMPAPFALTQEAMGHYCGMNLLEHPGPKGQIILKDIPAPIWFSSVRDAVSFTLLPEEPKDIAAIYVSDMGQAPSWDKPGGENWIDARTAFYVIGSALRGGMGAAEAVPFATQEAARQFAGKHGGQVVGFADIPADYVLGGEAANPGEGSEPALEKGGGPEHHHG